jgi:hypothetical protein
MISAVWVEIPVKDLERALKFYQQVFELEATEVTDDGTRKTTTLFGGDGKAAGISLNQTRNFEPADKGTLIYFDTTGEDLSEHLKRVEAAGGKIIESKTSMGAAGWYATFLDTEGNCFALYSVK